jgi:hypothetical protein
LFDRRGLAPMREVFQRLKRWERYFSGANSEAEVVLVFSRHTQDNYGGDNPHARYLDFIRGWYCALQEAHIAFDVLSDKLIAPERLARYRAVIISNLACVSDETASALEQYVAQGGGLVASFEAGWCDVGGVERAEPAFVRLFGGVYGTRRDNLKSSYAKIERRDDPLLAGIGDTDVLPNDGALRDFRPGPGRDVPLTLIPPVIAHSGATISIPEYSAVRAVGDVPVAVRGEFGAGCIVYFANQMEGLFHHYGFADLGRVLANAVRYVQGGPGELEVDAPDFVDVTLMGQMGRWLVHLVNLPVGKPLNTGWRHPGRNLIDVNDIKVRLRPRAGKQVREVRLATTEQVLTHIVNDGWVAVTVPHLADHEIVIFEFE